MCNMREDYRLYNGLNLYSRVSRIVGYRVVGKKEIRMLWFRVDAKRDFRHFAENAILKNAYKFSPKRKFHLLLVFNLVHHTDHMRSITRFEIPLNYLYSENVHFFFT